MSQDKQILPLLRLRRQAWVINFVMQMENMTFPEAVRHLAAQVGMEVPEHRALLWGEAEKGSSPCAPKAPGSMWKSSIPLKESKAFPILLGRGLSPGTLKHFGLGFAPDSWDSLIHAMTAKGFTKGKCWNAALWCRTKAAGSMTGSETGSCSPSSTSGPGHRLRRRRVMDDSMPKYLNSSDTPVFQKSQNLFI